MFSLCFNQPVINKESKAIPLWWLLYLRLPSPTLTYRFMKCKKVKSSSRTVQTIYCKQLSQEAVFLNQPDVHNSLQSWWAAWLTEMLGQTQSDLPRKDLVSTLLECSGFFVVCKNVSEQWALEKRMHYLLDQDLHKTLSSSKVRRVTRSNKKTFLQGRKLSQEKASVSGPPHQGPSREKY